MMKISSAAVSVISPVWIFLISSFILYLIFYQIIGFFGGFLILIFLFFLTFWQDFLSFRLAGELIGLKSRSQIFIISTIFGLGFGELTWVVSFLPFPFFILSGILAVIFGAVLDIYKENFKRPAGSGFDAGIKKILTRDIAAGIILIIIFIFISPWLPQRGF